MYLYDNISIAQLPTGKNACLLISLPSLDDVMSQSELTTQFLLFNFAIQLPRLPPQKHLYSFYYLIVPHVIYSQIFASNILALNFSLVAARLEQNWACFKTKYSKIINQLEI